MIYNNNHNTVAYTEMVWLSEREVTAKAGDQSEIKRK